MVQSRNSSHRASEKWEVTVHFASDSLSVSLTASPVDCTAEVKCELRDTLALYSTQLNRTIWGSKVEKTSPSPTLSTSISPSLLSKGFYKPDLNSPGETYFSCWLHLTLGLTVVPSTTDTEVCTEQSAWQAMQDCCSEILNLLHTTRQDNIPGAGFSETHGILAEFPFPVHVRWGGRWSKKDNRDDRQRDFWSWALSLATD